MKETLRQILLLLASLLFFLLLPQTARAGEAIPADYFLTQTNGGTIEARYRDMGPYETASFVMSKRDDAYLGYRYKVWYPKVSALAEKSFPLVIMVNGTGSSYELDEPVYEHLASWGFVVAGNTDPNTALGHTADYTLSLALAENRNERSRLYQRIDETSIGIYGFSQGGPGAIHALLFRRGGSEYKTIVTVSAVTKTLMECLRLDSWQYETKNIKIPYFMVASTGAVDRKVICPLSEMEDAFKEIPASTPAVMARRRWADHSTVQAAADGYITAWLCWQLKNDRYAAGAFTGPSPELFTNPLWDNAERKGM